jgi:phosphatidylserine/phosphatidylglycerophosphate/cardiolipin synthase-like enzyme
MEKFPVQMSTRGKNMLNNLEQELREKFIHDSTGLYIDEVFTQGDILDWTVDSLHNVIRFQCKYVKTARESVNFVSSYWEGKSMSAFMVVNAFKSVPSSCTIRVLVDNGNWRNVMRNNRFCTEREKRKMGLSDDFLVKSLHVPLLGTMHAKFIIVDEIAIISSNNVQDRPNLEFALAVTGPIVSKFKKIFNHFWFDDSSLPVSLLSESEDRFSSRMVLANRPPCGSLFRKDETVQNITFLHLMAKAQTSIHISSPTLNHVEAVQAIFDACKRNVKVHILLTKHFNDRKEALPFQGGTNQYVVKHLQRKLRKHGKSGNFRLQWYVGPDEVRPRIGVHSHVKFMAIDEKICILGNANMDTQSWRHSMELNLVIENELFTRHFIKCLWKDG